VHEQARCLRTAVNRYRAPFDSEVHSTVLGYKLDDLPNALMIRLFCTDNIFGSDYVFVLRHTNTSDGVHSRF